MKNLLLAIFIVTLVVILIPSNKPTLIPYDGELASQKRLEKDYRNEQSKILQAQFAERKKHEKESGVADQKKRNSEVTLTQLKPMSLREKCWRIEQEINRETRSRQLSRLVGIHRDVELLEKIASNELGY